MMTLSGKAKDNRLRASTRLVQGDLASALAELGSGSGPLRLPVVRLDSADDFSSRYHRVARGLLPSDRQKGTSGKMGHH